MRTLIIILSVLVLSACASRLPEPVRGDGTEVTTFNQVMQDPSGLQGERVRWGGVIARVENRVDHTMLEIVNFTLRGTGRPYVSDRTPGRFRVLIDGFVDPEVYQQGRSITVLGEYTGLEDGSIGEYQYSFPLVRATGNYLWEEAQQSGRVEVWYHDPYSPWYRHRLYGTGPYRYHPYYFPYGVRVDSNRSGERQESDDSTPPFMVREPQGKIQQEH